MLLCNFSCDKQYATPRKASLFQLYNAEQSWPHAQWLQGQDPSDKYTDQAKSVVGSAAADMLKNSPDINKEGGGVGNPDIKMDSMQAKGFSQDKQATGGKDTPKDIRGGKMPLDLPQRAHIAPCCSGILSLSRNTVVVCADQFISFWLLVSSR